jgi:hypothetical protein
MCWILVVEAGAIYVMDRGHLDFERLFTMHQAGAFFVTRAKVDMDARRVYSTPRRPQQGRHLRPAHHAQQPALGQQVSGAPAAHSIQGPRDRQDAGLLDQQHDLAGTDGLRALQEPLDG